MKLYIRLAGVFLSILLLAGCGQDGGTGQSLAERIKKDMETLKPVSLSLISEDPENPLMLVNKRHWLTADYVPSDLVSVADFSVGGGKAKAAVRSAYEALYQSARKEGYDIRIVSAYRDYALQKELFAYWTRVDGPVQAERTSARPGRSEHQTGYALDVSCLSEGWDLQESFGSTPEGKWLAENCCKYGFIIRYQKDTESITGYAYEPWHIRYVGREAAAEIFEKNITLEAYLQEF